MPKFSVITPAYNHNEFRRRDLDRCVSSLLNQSFQKFEHIIVDQTDNEDFDMSWLDEVGSVRWFQQPHLERLYALREGFEQAMGEWFCLLDSDDIYLPHYLETCNLMIEENPEHKMFNFGNIYIHRDGRVTSRDVFKPEMKEVGHEEFGGGCIVNGTFIFHRSVWEDLGDFPTTTDKLWNPWDFSIAAQEEFPELQKYFMVDHEDEPEKIAKELGNPWGNDFYLFYKYTRKYHSLPIDKHLHCVYNK
jgi:glycosyltransferase involved in cell wall biosynthesis